MSILSLVQPIESVVPAAEDALSMAALMLRTIGGLGAVAAILMLFRPLLTGIWHALLITVKPHLTPAQRTALRQRESKSRQAVISSENSIT
jgi:hypothetical protein